MNMSYTSLGQHCKNILEGRVLAEHCYNPRLEAQLEWRLERLPVYVREAEKRELDLLSYLEQRFGVHFPRAVAGILGRSGQQANSEVVVCTVVDVTEVTVPEDDDDDCWPDGFWDHLHEQDAYSTYPDPITGCGSITTSP